MNIILLGKSGAGKGTQASLLAKRFNFQHFSTGELFRRHLKDNTDLGKKIYYVMHSSKLVPDEIVNEVVLAELDRMQHDNIVFDGYPRTIPQAKYLNSSLKNPIDYVFLLAVYDSTALERMSKRQEIDQRSETDGLERRISRLKEYEHLTSPLVWWYDDRQKLIVINGEECPSCISRKIEGYIKCQPLH